MIQEIGLGADNLSEDSMKIAIFPLCLFLFYIVNNGGKSRTVCAWPRPQESLSRKKGKPL